MVLRDPNNYISNYLTRGAVTYAPETQALYTQLAGAWLMFAFIEAVVLRSFDDLRLWRLLCVAMLPSDVAFAYSAAQAVGGWAAYFDVGSWTREDWGTFLSTLLPLVVRLLVVPDRKSVV